MHTLVLTCNDAALFWWQLVVSAGWQASLVAVIVLFLVRIGRRWPAPVRTAALLVALIKFLVPPTLPSPVSLFGAAKPFATAQVTTHVIHTPEAVTPSMAPILTQAQTVAATPSISVETRSESVINPTPAPRLTLTAWLLVCQAAGSLVVCVCIAIKLFQLRQLARGARPLNDGPVYARMLVVARLLGVRPVRELLISPGAVAPMAFGILRRRVLLPQTVVAALSPSELDAVLAHELAHHHRHDALMMLVQLAVVVVWWFNPLAWLLANELRRTREECCDDIVLCKGVASGPDYCRTILAAAKHLATKSPIGGALMLADQMHPLGNRMRRIMDPNVVRKPRLSWAALAAVLLLAALILPGSRLRAQEKPQQENPSNAPVADGTSVAGVTVREDGSPVAGAQVSLLLSHKTYYGALNPRKVTAGADGKFVFDGVAAGDYRIWALSGNLASRNKRLGGQLLKVPVAQGDAGSVKLVLHPGRTIRATVTSAIDGKPIAGALLHLTWTDTVPDFKTDATGLAVIEALTPETWQVEATAPGKMKVVKLANLASAAENTVDFSLPDGGSLSGKVTDIHGKPAANVGVGVYAGYIGIPGSVRTATDGTYRLDNLPLDQTCRILFEDGAYAVDWKTITLTVTQRQRELNVTLEPKPIGLSVTGTVRDLDGKPIVGARVMYYGHSSNDVTTVRTDSTGAFRVNGIQPFGDVPEQIIVRADGWAPKVVSVEQPETKDAPVQLAVRMTERGHRITGRVENENGKPINGARVEASNSAGPDNRGVVMTTGSDGRFHFDSLDPRATFDVWAGGYTDIHRKALPLDGDDVVTVTMEEKGSITGKVVDVDSGQPVPKFNIRIRMNYIELSREESGEDFGGGDGAFRLDNLQGGLKAMLTVSAEGYPPQYFDEISSPGGKGEPVVIRLSKNPSDYIRLAGRIVDSAGKPLAGVEVRAVVYTPDDSDYPKRFRFNWGMLKSGQLAMQPYIRTIEQTGTAADGSFAFASIKGPDADLAYWGSGVPQTRLADIGSQSAEQRDHLDLHAPAPATLSGKINPVVYPNASGMLLHSLTDSSYELEIHLQDGANHYVLTDLPPGTYKLLVQGKIIRNVDGTFQSPWVGTAEVKVKEGESRQFDLGFGKGDVPTTRPGQ